MARRLRKRFILQIGVTADTDAGSTRAIIVAREGLGLVTTGYASVVTADPAATNIEQRIDDYAAPIGAGGCSTGSRASHSACPGTSAGGHRPNLPADVQAWRRAALRLSGALDDQIKRLTIAEQAWSSRPGAAQDVASPRVMKQIVEHRVLLHRQHEQLDAQQAAVDHAEHTVDALADATRQLALVYSAVIDAQRQSCPSDNVEGTISSAGAPLLDRLIERITAAHVDLTHLHNELLVALTQPVSDPGSGPTKVLLIAAAALTRSASIPTAPDAQRGHAEPDDECPQTEPELHEIPNPSRSTPLNRAPEQSGDRAGARDEDRDSCDHPRNGHGVDTTSFSQLPTIGRLWRQGTSRIANAVESLLPSEAVAAWSIETVTSTDETNTVATANEPIAAPTPKGAKDRQEQGRPISPGGRRRDLSSERQQLSMSNRHWFSL